MSRTELTEEQIKQIDEDVKATISLIIRNSGSYGFIEQLIGSSPFTKNSKYESLYTHATEDMATYYKEFKVTDSFLTIGASGDQVINAINSGAKTIDVYDSNSLCKHALYLKLAAIKALSYEEFINFYNTFSPFLFVILADYLPEEELAYWGSLYSMLGPTDIRTGGIICDKLFTYKKLDNELIKRINPYLNPERFTELKSIIDSVSINFIDSPLYDLPQHIQDKSYDVINLSNIYEYLNFGSDVTFSNAKRYRNFVIDELYPKLNPDGTMLVSYLYAWSDALNEDFGKMYKESGCRVVGTGALSPLEYIAYLKGLTAQNLAYYHFFDAFKNDPIEKIATRHVEFGQSKDMSHDMAVILRK